MQKIITLTKASFNLLNHAQPLWLLFARIWIAVIFFKAGLTKIDDFETTVFLFQEEYQVPVLSPYFAALSGTFFELVMPVLLVLGLGTRFAAIPLLIMTAVIQFTYMDHLQHYYWAILLSALIVYGGGRLSADHYVKRFFAK